MKKKVIESHPWQLEGKRTNRKKSFYTDSYVLDDQMLFIDCYNIESGTYEKCWRIALSDFDHITLYADGSWSNASIEHTVGLEYYGIYSGRAERETSKYYISKETESLIKEWIGDRYRFTSSNIFRAIYDYQYHLRQERKVNAEQKHYTKLQKLAMDCPELPKNFKGYLRDKIYRDKHILYYSDESAFCSRCGRDFPKIKKYKHNEIGSCPRCRKRVVFKSIKRVTTHADDCEVLIIQEHNDKVLFRYVKTSLIQDGEHQERIEYTESVRTFHDECLRYKSKLIHYYDGMTGYDYWSDKNGYYSQVVYGRNTVLYTGNREELETLICREWLDILEYFTNAGIKIPIISFLEMGEYRRNICERMLKAGFGRLTKEFVKGNIYGFNMDAKELKGVLRLSKPLFNWAQKRDVSLAEYMTLREAYEGDYGLSDAEIIELASAKIGIGLLKSVTKNRKFMKTFHYLQKAAGYKDINERMRHYRDYLGMAASMDYDLGNDTVRYPKNIKAAHDKATSEFNLVEADIKKKEAILKYPMIGAVSQKLQEIYGFHDKEYEIVAPANAGDIIEEGRILHHCVGGDNYLNKHNTGTSLIIFMRKIESPEQRYYTIEIDSKSQEIKQYYGAYDKKPDKEKVDKFLNKWKRHIREEFKNGTINVSELYAV